MREDGEGAGKPVMPLVRKDFPTVLLGEGRERACD